MRNLWLWIWLLCVPVWAEVGQEISRACRREPAFYQACLSNLENYYSPGYRAYDLFAYLEKPGRLALKAGPGRLVETGFPLDLALDGPGFFVLSEGLLTRSCMFRVRGGKICSPQGQSLLGCGPNSTRLEPLMLDDEPASISLSSSGELEYVRQNGDGRRESAGRLAIAQVAHPQWLRPSRGQLMVTPASGGRQLGMGSSRVVCQQLELSNASPLEQQSACRGLYALAGINTAGNSALARRDLVRLIQQHDQRCSGSLENLKHVNEAGYRAGDLFGRRLRITSGPLRETKNPYDLAIDGDGYFVLEGGLLTRAGDFQWSRAGHLLTRDGIQLMGARGPLAIPSGMSNLDFKGDGSVFGTRLNGDGKPEFIDQIPLARVRDGARLERSGSHLKVTAESGPAHLDTPGKDGRGVVAQGYLESGNVNPIEQIKTLHALRNYARLLGMPLADDYQP